jgi:hypothetical protein
LQRLQRFSGLVSSGVVLRLAQEGECVHLYLRAAPGLEQAAPASHDYAVGMITRICRLTLGEFLAPPMIRMQRPPPADPARW